MFQSDSETRCSYKNSFEIVFQISFLERSCFQETRNRKQKYLFNGGDSPCLASMYRTINNNCFQKFQSDLETRFCYKNVVVLN